MDMVTDWTVCLPFWGKSENIFVCKNDNCNMFGRSMIMLLLIWYGSLNMGRRVKMCPK